LKCVFIIQNAKIDIFAILYIFAVKNMDIYVRKIARKPSGTIIGLIQNYRNLL